MAFTLEETSIELPGGVASRALAALPDYWQPGRSIGAIIAHGMANDLESPLVSAVALGLAERGAMTLRFNFGYRQLGRERPDSKDEALADYLAAVAWLRTHPRYRPGWLILGGKSLGALTAARAALGDTPAAGLFHLGYPLHLPGREDKPRDAPILECPIRQLFIAGDRDPYCNLELLVPILERIVPEPALHVIPGGDHGLELPPGSDMRQQEVYEEVVAVIAGWLFGPAGRAVDGV